MTNNSIILSPNNLSTISFAVGFSTGCAAEEIRGISEILTSHLTRNTAKRDEVEFAKHLDYYGIVPFSSVRKTGTWLGFNTPPQNLGVALDTLREVIFEPNFDDDTIGKLVQQQKGYLSQLEQIPQARLFQTTRWKAAFGKSRVSRHGMGTAEDLDKITSENLTSHFEDLKSYQPKFVSIGVGNDPNYYSDFLADIESLGNKTSSIDLRDDSVPPLNVQVDKMDSTTKNAYVGINMVSQGYHNTNLEDIVFENIMSGGVSNRLMMEIREKRNLSYGAFALNSKMKEFGLITIALDVRPDRIEEAIPVALQTMRDVLDNPIPDDELGRALKTAQRTALFVADSSQQYTNFVMGRFLNGREWDLDKINNNIKEAFDSKWQDKMLQFVTKNNLSLGIAGEPGNGEDIWGTAVESVI